MLNNATYLKLFNDGHWRTLEEMAAVAVNAISPADALRAFVYTDGMPKGTRIEQIRQGVKLVVSRRTGHFIQCGMIDKRRRTDTARADAGRMEYRMLPPEERLYDRSKKGKRVWNMPQARS